MIRLRVRNAGGRMSGRVGGGNAVAGGREPLVPWKVRHCRWRVTGTLISVVGDHAVTRRARKAPDHRVDRVTFPTEPDDCDSIYVAASVEQEDRRLAS